MMKTLLKQVLAPFGVESVSTKVNHFYDLFKFSAVFMVALLPWWLLNLSVKFTMQTIGLYALIGIWIYPNIVALFAAFAHIYEGNSLTLRESWRYYWQQVRIKLWHSLKLGLIGNVVIAVFAFELLLSARTKQLVFMMYPLIILGAFTLAVIIYAVFHTACYQNADRLHRTLETAMWLSWRYVIRTAAIAALVVLWVSISYNALIVNILIGNVSLLWAIYRLTSKKASEYLLAIATDDEA